MLPIPNKQNWPCIPIHILQLETGSSLLRPIQRDIHRSTFAKCRATRTTSYDTILTRGQVTDMGAFIKAQRQRDDVNRAL